VDGETRATSKKNGVPLAVYYIKRPLVNKTERADCRIWGGEELYYGNRVSL